MREMTSAYKTFVGRPEGKRPLGRPRHRWDNSIINLREIGWKGFDWTGLIWPRKGTL
jgi:hypothetical protein